jgi:hypothetical protein
MKQLDWYSAITFPIKKEVKMIWKTDNVKGREELEKLLNVLEAEGCTDITWSMDQAQGNFIVAWKKPKTELLSD